MKIYVASSWRNPAQPSMVEVLREKGHEVYDFRNPVPGSHGFHWSEIDPDWKDWTPEVYREALEHPLAVEHFRMDFGALVWAEVVLGLQPFGRSASMELGWAAGAGKKTILLLSSGEPEMMVKMFDYICCSLDEVLTALDALAILQETETADGPQCSCGRTMEGKSSVEVQETGCDAEGDLDLCEACGTGMCSGSLCSCCIRAYDHFVKTLVRRMDALDGYFDDERAPFGQFITALSEGDAEEKEAVIHELMAAEKKG